MSSNNIKNKQHLTVNDNNFISREEIGIDLVLTNGEVLNDLIKKAQQQSTELNKTLEYINHFVPNYRLK